LRNKKAIEIVELANITSNRKAEIFDILEGRYLGN
jgi:hypothetical protein